MRIRRATRKDLNEVGNLMKREFSKPPFKERVSIKDVLKSLRFYLKIGRIYLAIKENEIIGIIVFKIEQYWEGKVIIIEDLAINKKFQSQGIGKKLMKFVESYAKKEKAEFVLFATNKKSEAIKFYKKLGYKPEENTVFMGKKIKKKY